MSTGDRLKIWRRRALLRKWWRSSQSLLVVLCALGKWLNLLPNIVLNYTSVCQTDRHSHHYINTALLIRTGGTGGTDGTGDSKNGLFATKTFVWGCVSPLYQISHFWDHPCHPCHPCHPRQLEVPSEWMQTKQQQKLRHELAVPARNSEGIPRNLIQVFFPSLVSFPGVH